MDASSPIPEPRRSPAPSSPGVAVRIAVLSAAALLAGTLSAASDEAAPALVDPETAALAARAKVEAPSHLVFVGDSLTSFLPETNYVAILRAALQARLGEGVAVTNAGVGGDTIVRVEARLDEDVLSLRPKPTRVFLFLGHNDSKLSSASDYRDAFVAPDEFRRAYGEVIRRIRRETGARVTVLSATSSVFEITRETAEKRRQAGKAHNLFGQPEALEKFNAIAREVAEETGADYLDLYGPTRSHPEKRRLYTKDAVHTTEFGNRAIALEILKSLAEQAPDGVR